MAYLKRKFKLYNGDYLADGQWFTPQEAWDYLVELKQIENINEGDTLLDLCEYCDVDMHHFIYYDEHGTMMGWDYEQPSNELVEETLRNHPTWQAVCAYYLSWASIS